MTLQADTCNEVQSSVPATFIQLLALQIGLSPAMLSSIASTCTMIGPGQASFVQMLQAGLLTEFQARSIETLLLALPKTLGVFAAGSLNSTVVGSSVGTVYSACHATCRTCLAQPDDGCTSCNAGSYLGGSASGQVIGPARCTPELSAANAVVLTASPDRVNLFVLIALVTLGAALCAGMSIFAALRLRKRRQQQTQSLEAFPSNVARAPLEQVGFSSPIFVADVPVDTAEKHGAVHDVPVTRARRKRAAKTPRASKIPVVSKTAAGASTATMIAATVPAKPPPHFKLSAVDPMNPLANAPASESQRRRRQSSWSELYDAGPAPGDVVWPSISRLLYHNVDHQKEFTSHALQRKADRLLHRPSVRLEDRGRRKRTSDPLAGLL